MKILISAIFVVGFGLIGIAASQGLGSGHRDKAPSQMKDLAPATAAVLSAPFVGCEPMDMEILRPQNADGNASWVVICEHRKFICGMSRTSSGHTIFCQQTGCRDPGDTTDEGGEKKTKV